MLSSLVSAALAIHLVASQPTYTNAIASETVSTQNMLATWFDSLPTYHIPTDAIPASPAVPADSPARDLVYGAPLTFTVGPVNPASSFQVSMTFLDDAVDYHRRMALTIGSTTIAPAFTLPAQTIFTATYNVSSATVSPQGHTLTFTLTASAGPNAILSSFTLYSSNPSDPAIHPPQPALPTHDLPRLTPTPVTVQGTDTPTLPLMGTWAFNPSPSPSLLHALHSRSPALITRHLGDANWTTIAVPSEYTLQGFAIPPYQPVVYQTTLDVPPGWGGLRTKLKCDGIYSNATVFLNGGYVGGHLGGFTPFELDVTQWLSPSANNLTIVVVGSSLADTLASGSQYATHDLGGITRKLYLFAVPAVSIADVHVVTTFSDPPAYTQATLTLNVSVANDGPSPTTQATIVSVAVSYGGGGGVTGSGTLTFPAGVPGGGVVVYQPLAIAFTSPPLWDPEHPRLHDLTLSILPPASYSAPGATPTLTTTLRFGFRQVSLLGPHSVAINGRPVKARGTTRHEAHPWVGRSLWGLSPQGGQWARDIAQFRDAANINYIRTSHYPPPGELMDAGDELGMMIEVEMPFCWASGNAGGEALNYTVQAQREAMVANRNHPSVLQWSLGNESPWTGNFADSLGVYLREIDSTRPFMFDGGSSQPVPPLDLQSVHYPNFDGPGYYSNGSWPVLFGEYAHLNCYNRREIAADPGVRDIWGLGIEHMWELIEGAPGVLGACYWAGIDDLFWLPGPGAPVGYGEWGVVDGFRREKPETFMVKNIYSPIKLPTTPATPVPYTPPGSGGLLALSPILNRHDFTDLREIGWAWGCVAGDGSGVGGNASVTGSGGGPRSADGTLTLSGLPTLPTWAGCTVEVNATSPRGYLINSWIFPVATSTTASSSSTTASFGGREGKASGPPPPPPTVTSLPGGGLRITDARTPSTFFWEVSPTGNVTGSTQGGGAIVTSGPQLMVLAINNEGGSQITVDSPPILPFNDPLGGWQVDPSLPPTHKLPDDPTTGTATVVWGGNYSGSAAGVFTLGFDGQGGVRVEWDFTWTSHAPISPRQMGVVFGVSGGGVGGNLSWSRRTPPWVSGTYPPTHIGRPVGVGVAPLAGPPLGLNASREGIPWSYDPSPLGCPDYRSTRHNVTAFVLGSGQAGLSLVSPNGTVHGRAWWGGEGEGEGEGAFLLAAVHSNEGGNPFSRERVLPQPQYSEGDAVAGVVQLQLGSVL